MQISAWTKVHQVPLTEKFILYVGEHPYRKRENAAEIETGKAWIRSNFSATVNVGDDGATLLHQVEGVPHYWQPIQEMSRWSYSTLFAIKRTLDYLFALSEAGAPQKVLIHCHGGVNRSQTLAQLWIESLAVCNGGPLAKVPKIAKGVSEIEKNFLCGHLPQGVRKFYAAMNANQTYGCMGVLQLAGLYEDDIAQTPMLNNVWHILKEAGFHPQEYTLKTAIQNLIKSQGDKTKTPKEPETNLTHE